jgi:hypothetical protein
VQLCGWVRNLELCTGMASMTLATLKQWRCYKNRSSQLAEADEMSTESCLNIFDKGHRCTLAAAELSAARVCKKQRTVQA